MPPIEKKSVIFVANSRNGERACRIATCLYLAAWVLFIALSASRAPLFGRWPHTTPTDDTPFPDQSRLTPLRVAFNSFLALGVFEGPSGSKPENIAEFVDGVCYYGSFFLFVTSPIYFAARRETWIFLPWTIIATILFLGFGFSGRHSLDSHPTSGITRPIKLWGFHSLAVVFALTTAAIWVYEYSWWKRRRAVTTGNRVSNVATTSERESQ